ncbi:MAG: alpha-glucuronidase family glycosyl hydrolase [Candidatus Solibacter sp.]
MLRYLLLLAALPLHAEMGLDAWLRHAPLDETSARTYRAAVPAGIVNLTNSPVTKSAQGELLRGIQGMLGRTLRVATALPAEPAIVLGTVADLKSAAPQLKIDSEIPVDGYWLTTAAANGVTYTVITGSNDRGVLYGSFAFLRKIALGETLAKLNDKQSPYAPVRWINSWDNLDGTIERGYGGRSIFWDKMNAREDLSRVGEYGRLLASLGINACAVNNVNSNPRMLAADFVAQIARVADAFRPWGVRVAISVDFGSPQTVGGLDTFDPLEPKVAEWWKQRVDAIYAQVPDFAGFVLKADSEGRVGPATYKRTHADAANLLARPLKAHGGLVFYRGFVYDHHADWNDPKADRGRAAWDNFQPLDGKFDDNVVVQIKHGPIDFQVREPASPLFGALEKTNQAVELQITQEYFGQGRHTVFLVPMWKEALDFDMHAAAGPTPVKALVAGKVFHRPTGGFVGVSNVGLDENWYGNHMSQANLYGFGRLAWNPDLSAQKISEEWTRQTFGADPEVARVVNRIQLSSWRTFENYTGPLGLQTLTDIVGDHYGVAVEASERNGWGQWHNADEKGAGMERTIAKGTGYTGQYRPAVTKVFESLETCPDELLLFMHHVPYTYKLHNGKTVIQFLYDAHYEGSEAVYGWVKDFLPLKGKLDDQRYAAILGQLQYQAAHTEVWRDAVNDWFHKTSGIADAKGRVGTHPGRTEAEAMKLEGYTVRDIRPWETASGGKAIGCASGKCTATLRYEGPAGWFNLSVQYFDLATAVSHFKLSVGAQQVDEWAATDRLPARELDSSSSTRRLITGIALRPGDEIRIEGTPAGAELAALDYIEIH